MNTSKKRFQFATATRIFIFALLGLAILLPLCFMMASLGQVNFFSVISSSMFLSALFNSFLVGIVATIISISFAFILSYVIGRSNIRFQGILTVLFTVPMLLPSISHGMGIVVLFGDNGIITRFLHLSSGLNGFWAIVFGSVMYSFPTAYLMFNDIFKYEDRTIYQAADIMGIPKYRQFFDLTLPYIKKPLISIIFSVFTLVFTDYGVAMMVGGRFTTLPLYMYNEVIGQLRFGVGAVVGLVLIIPAIAAFVFDLFNKDTGNLSYSVKQIFPAENKKRDMFVYILSFLSCAVILVPIFLFSIIGFFNKYPSDMHLTFANVLRTINMGGGRYLLNSLIISLYVSVIGVLVSFITAYISARTRSKANRYLHLMSIISMAIPGVVLGLSYSLMYKGSFIYGTLAMLVLVNVVHFFSSPYLLCYNALNKVNKNYEIISKTLQISRVRLCTDVLIPQLTDTLIEMFSYFFVNSMVTISAVSFLATSANMPLALLVNSFETQMFIECASIVSLMILIINGILKTVFYFIKRRRFIKNA